MSILVDNRAGSSDLMKYEPFKSQGELCRLDSADVAFTGFDNRLIGVEVKSVWDVISSMANGRLQGTQIPAMLAAYDVNWLVVYGQYRAGPDGALKIRRGGRWTNFVLGKRAVGYGYIDSMMLTLAHVGVGYRNVADAAQAAAWIGILHRWWQKRPEQHDGLKAFDNSRPVSDKPAGFAVVEKLSPATLQRAEVASKLPNVGYKRAVAVARHFPSIEDMVHATEAEWKTVPGIGSVIAGVVYRAIRERETAPSSHR